MGNQPAFFGLCMVRLDRFFERLLIPYSPRMDVLVLLGTLVICSVVLFFQQFFSWKSKVIPGVPFASGFNPLFGNLFPMMAAMEDGFLEYVNSNMRANGFEHFQVMGPGVAILYTCNSSHVEHFYAKDSFPEWVKGKDLQEAFSETLGHGIFVVDGKEWIEKRKVSSYLFSSNSLRNHMAGVFFAHTHDVLENLSAIETGKTVDLQDLFARYTFDSICTIAFGMDVNSLGGKEEDVRFQKSYDIAQTANSTRLYDPLWKVKKFLGVGMEGQLPSLMKNVDDYIYKIIDQRLEEMKNEVDRGDMLSLYIKHGQKKSKQFDRRYLRDMILNFIIAGRDTTAAASMWLIYEIAQDTKAEATLLKEIEECIGDEDPTYDIIIKMPYLRAVFYETLRLHPSVPLDGKFPAHEEVFLEPGHLHVKKGTLVQFNIAMMNRDPKRYTDPEKFLPERWLSSDGKFVEMEEKEFPTFNLKPRGCLGKRMAEFEAAMLIAVLLPKLKFRVEEGFVPIPTTSVILFNKNGMRVHVEKRK